MSETIIGIKWERIGTPDFGGRTYRCPVPGGWVVQTFLQEPCEASCNGFRPQTSMVFVPDPHHEWLKTDQEKANMDAIESALSSAESAIKAVYGRFEGDEKSKSRACDEIRKVISQLKKIKL